MVPPVGEIDPNQRVVKYHLASDCYPNFLHLRARSISEAREADAAGISDFCAAFIGIRR